MAHSVESKTTSNPANLLRDKLTAAERELVQLNGNNAEGYLIRLDEIEALFERIEMDNADLRPEQVRWDTLIAQLSSKPEPLAAAAAKAGGLATLRAKHPPADSFWWHVDAEVRSRRLRATRRVIVTLVTLVVVVVGGYQLINFVFPPNAEAVRMLGVSNDIEQLTVEGQWAEALTLVKAVQEEIPNNPELFLWEVVLSKQLGLDAEAEEALATAKTLLPNNEPELLSQLGNYYLQINDIENAAAVSENALASAGENPQVTFLAANVAERQNDVATAIDYFERTFELAEDDFPSLAVTARFRLGILLQSAPAMVPDPPITPTLTITDTAFLMQPLTP